MIGAVLGLVGGPLGKWLAGAAAAGALLLAGWLWLAEHDARVRAEQAARARAVAAAQRLVDAQRAIAAEQQVADAAVARATALATARQEIAHAPPPAPNCAAPAAVLRAVDALRASP